MQLTDFKTRTVNPNQVLEVGIVTTPVNDSTIDTLEISLGVTEKTGAFGFTITFASPMTSIVYGGYASRQVATNVRNAVITLLEQKSDNTRTR